MRLPASERQRRLDTLRRELADTRERAGAALRTARVLAEAVEAGDKRFRDGVRSARQRWRQLVARGNQIEGVLDQLAASLAKRPPASERQVVRSDNGGGQ